MCLPVFSADVNCTYQLNTTYSAATLSWNFKHVYRALALNVSAGRTDGFFSNSSLFLSDAGC